MSVNNKAFVTPEQYLAGEKDADQKHEYHEGTIAALPGASPAHATTTNNVAGDLRLQLRGRPYRLFANHLRIKVEATAFYTYPDIVVVCDQPIIAMEGERPNTVVNPILIIEITSDATEAADQGKKFDNYRQIPGLREYVLIGHRGEPGTITSYLRPETGTDWVKTEVSGPKDLLYLASIDCTLTVADVYAANGVEADQT